MRADVIVHCGDVARQPVSEREHALAAGRRAGEGAGRGGVHELLMLGNLFSGRTDWEETTGRPNIVRAQLRTLLPNQAMELRAMFASKHSELYLPSAKK